ncbi:MAG: hypothetical protein COV10_00060 [Candidatus Vogelbacteria bacterium CG10_big_fil_rev_8_21_14_0_10_51_16]|uniref:Uncharacterized protein n=1 Tax=Candidatus Vogelbacteria bacterium CG10_big_fil_rev_8_21_14_0_10_51_16 TaxID=1975045 RepID=A0A2H0RFL9_9BACT|nr:MAG: hypothetical protein COV10_00060 [Candidatus Vogelbacteria bacterium CG10_big_fil_rev_8_21_14_0_10_51_16]
MSEKRNSDMPLPESEEDIKPRFAKVFGWGAVEKKATEWSPTSKIEEVENNLFRVVDETGRTIGAIGKDPWTPEAIERKAREWCLKTKD